MPSALISLDTPPPLACLSSLRRAVCFVDPKAVLMHHEWAAQGTLERHADESHYECIEMPRTLLPELSKGVLELGDGDDPLNAW